MADGLKNCTLVPTIEDKDVYRIAFDTRNLEISLFWQRSNYFLVLNSGLALAYFNLSKWQYSIAIAIFGWVVALLWYRVNLGSKFWQARWEQRLAEIEHRLAPNLNMFSADYKIIEGDVRKSQNLKPANKFRIWLNNQILSKPSVSGSMTILSMLFILGWTLLIVLTPFVGQPGVGAPPQQRSTF